ncbi:hypothetical protein Clacol_000907 [Clathrus columnatus]|uniref:Lactoylglutathione lyase n=1 Tax=Clathrus columnatus TaxID=1419009 RepID=A0AAV5A2C8_9AGAM|nr:hypothetical protein Clacol_000907 [Clathrus columnatus]
MPRSTETASFMDPEISVKFYTKVLGTELISELRFSEFMLYMLAYDHSNGNDSLETKQERKLKHEGTWNSPFFSYLLPSCTYNFELSHYHGMESDPDFMGYANGNTNPRGFGHIA